MDSIPQKRCTGCGEEKPATPEYFARDKKRKDGLYPRCKQCGNEYYLKNKDALSAKQNDYYLRNSESQKAARRARYLRNREQEQTQQYGYRQKNKSKINQYGYDYRQGNKAKIAQRDRLYRRNNPHLASVQKQRRRSRIYSLPLIWTRSHWKRCLEYWRYNCAVCGYPLKDVFGTVPHADHWIPLNYKGADNPGTVPENMICLCSACNLSKNKKLPEQWLTEQYGQRKARTIIQCIRIYFEWVRQRP